MRPTAALIVDDEPDHALIIRRLLADLAPGLPIEVVATLEELQPRLDETPGGALVLFDRLLGGIEVLPALRALANTRSDLTIALLSAWLSEEDEAAALKAGAEVAEQKPTTLEGWRSLLGGLLARARSA